MVAYRGRTAAAAFGDAQLGQAAQRNPDRNDRRVENNFNSAVAREMMDIAFVANVSQPKSRRGRSSVATPANAAIQASGLFSAKPGARWLHSATWVEGRICSSR
jgi:hypothetical protein